MTMPVAPKAGRTVIADSPASDSLFQRLPVARENERRMRAAQARRDRREEAGRYVLTPKQRRDRLEKVIIAQATLAAAAVAVVAGLVEFVRWN